MLQDKVIIVTGAARGIGREYCVQFAKLGASVIASDVKPCTDTVHEACQNGGRVIGFPADALAPLLDHAQGGPVPRLDGGAGGPLATAYLAAVARTAEYVNRMT